MSDPPSPFSSLGDPGDVLPLSSADQTESDKEKVTFIAQQAVAAYYEQESDQQEDKQLQQTTLGPFPPKEMTERRLTNPGLIDRKEPAEGKWKKIRRGVYEDPLGVTHTCSKCIHKQRKLDHAFFCTVSPRTYLKTFAELQEDERMAALKKPPAAHGESELRQSSLPLSVLSPQNRVPSAASLSFAKEEEEEEEEVISSWTVAELKNQEPSSMRLSSFIETKKFQDSPQEEDASVEANNCLIAKIEGLSVKVWLLGIDYADEEDGPQQLDEVVEEGDEPSPPDDDEDLRRETSQLENSGARKKIGISGRTLKKALFYLQEEKRTNGAISSAIHTYELLELFLELLCREPGVTIPVRMYWHLIFPVAEPDREKDKLRKIISLIISSSTTDAQVCLATQKLCNQKEFSLKYLLETPAQAIINIIRSAGRYKQNTTNIKKLCQMVRDVYGGKIPEELEEVCQLRGVYTKIAAVWLKVACKLIKAVPCDRHVKFFSLFMHWVPKCLENNMEAIRYVIEQRFPRAYWADFNEVIGGLAQIFAVQEHWEAIMHVASLPVFQANSGGGVFSTQITTLALQYNSFGRKLNHFDFLLTDFAKTQLIQAQARLESSPAEYESARTKLAVQACRDKVSAAKSALTIATNTHNKAKKLVSRKRKKPPSKAKKPPAKTNAKKPPANAKKPPANAKKPPANAKKPPANAKKPPAKPPKRTERLGGSLVLDLVELPTANQAPSLDCSSPSVFSLVTSVENDEEPPLWLKPYRPKDTPSLMVDSYEPNHADSESNGDGASIG